MIGSLQLLAYSTTSPWATKISAGRSAWLCHGTTPPGATVSLRNRNSWSLSITCSLPRSIEPKVVSVTPDAGVLTGGRTLACIFPAGHSPASALVATVAAPTRRLAKSALRPAARPNWIRVVMAYSPLSRFGPGEPQPQQYGKDRPTSAFREMPSGSRVDAQQLSLGIRDR